MTAGWLIVNSPLPWIRALPGMTANNFLGAVPGMDGADTPRDTDMLAALAAYRPT